MWEFYLAAAEMSFREQNMMVMQIQLAKRQGVVPITRDNISPAVKKKQLTHRPVRLVNCGASSFVARFPKKRVLCHNFRVNIDLDSAR